MLRSTLLQHVRREEADCSLARPLFPFVDFIRILTAGLSLEVREYTSNEVAGRERPKGARCCLRPAPGLHFCWPPPDGRANTTDQG